MHVYINHKCIAYIFKYDYPLQLFHKIVLYSLALENNIFSFPDLQNSTQVELPIFYSLLWGGRRRRKAKNSVVHLQHLKKQLSKIITFVSHSLYYRFELKNILQEAQFSNSKHNHHHIWSISLLLYAYTLENSLTDRVNPNSLRYYTFYEDREECDKRDR